MMSWKRKLAAAAVPAVLALGGGALAVHASSLALGGGALAVHASSTPPPGPSTPASQTGAEPSETTGGAEKIDATEAPGAPDVGHTDAAGANVDHQFEGNE